MRMLDKVVHARLIQEIDEVARMAGVPRRYIENGAKDILSDSEIKWLRGLRTHHVTGQFGGVFEGRQHVNEMMAMIGALTRNFIFAQLVTLNDLVEMLRENEPINATVLFVPSFHRASSKGGVTPFQTNLLWGLLEDRMMMERQTVIGVQSIAQMRVDYGAHFGDLISNHYTVI